MRVSTSAVAHRKLLITVVLACALMVLAVAAFLAVGMAGARSETARFAVIGDYGHPRPYVEEVAAEIRTWDVDLVITTGDNNYPEGSAETIDRNIGKAFHWLIRPYRGEYGQGADRNRFFPTLGNHDWDTDDAEPYLDYFDLPGNERYYTFTWGPVRFFALDSDPHEPDGVTADSRQGRWLREELEESDACWNVVYFHHTPYASGEAGEENPDDGGSDWMRWPFAKWGADVVFAGHHHIYERIERDGIVYIVSGLGGHSQHEIGTPVEGSRARFTGAYGAVRADATPRRLQIQFVTTEGNVVDEREIHHDSSTLASCDSSG